MARRRTPLLPNSMASCTKVLTSKSIKASTSSLGRFQFSVLKAYNVKYRTPLSKAASTVALTDSTPWACPNTLSSPRRLAQRPLPSMMTATCSGTRWGSMPAARMARSRASLGWVLGEVIVPSKLWLFC